jgi:hypothetical protein
VTALWLNGPFGVGKTTTARHIIEREARWRLFDPEWVGAMLRANLAGVEYDDFQELESWRTLVPIVAREVAATMRTRHLLVVQTVLVEEHWLELRRGFEREDLELVHVVLDCDEQPLRTRITADEDDPGAADWRDAHVDAYRSARDWMAGAADLVVDTTARTAAEAAELVVEFLRR